MITETVLGFPGLSERYDTVLILLWRDYGKDMAFLDEQDMKVFGEKPVLLRSDRVPELTSTGVPPTGCIRIDVSRFLNFPEWKQRLSVRNECCHLLHEENTGSTYEELKKKFKPSHLNNFVRYRREYVAHLCIINRWPQDWLNEPVGFGETVEPVVFYQREVMSKGKDAAIFDAMCNIVRLLSLVFLYESVQTDLAHRLGNRIERHRRYMRYFYRCMRRDMFNRPPQPEKWVTPADFLSEERYFRRINRILSYYSWDRS